MMNYESEVNITLNTPPSCLILCLTYLVWVSHKLMNLSEDPEATIEPS